jgi:hypothetical protein
VTVKDCASETHIDVGQQALTGISLTIYVKSGWNIHIECI